jgi:hypothetical protein
VNDRTQQPRLQAANATQKQNELKTNEVKYKFTHIVAVTETIVSWF